MPDPIAMALHDLLVPLVREAVADAFVELREGEVPPRTALLTREGLARELACSVPQVDKLRREGMPTLRVVDAPRFRLEHVLAWLEQRSAV